jgi:hypothetical protein
MSIFFFSSLSTIHLICVNELLLVISLFILLLSLYFYVKGEITLMHFFLVQVYLALNPAPPSGEMLAFVFLLAMLGTSARCAYAANAVGKAVSLNHTL